ncbi:hypothetical protein [Pedobacter sp. SL55]|nr:hypothetical protein [Pedobacter sp. SL55]WAC41490.1 hypothetical protein OVA16_03755 [Pedobacter sp. SL55]
MKNLSKEEMMEINGGAVDKKKERSGYSGAFDMLGNAVTGFGGWISSWFN